MSHLCLSFEWIWPEFSVWGRVRNSRIPVRIKPLSVHHVCVCVCHINVDLTVVWFVKACECVNHQRKLFWCSHTWCRRWLGVFELLCLLIHWIQSNCKELSALCVCVYSSGWTRPLAFTCRRRLEGRLGDRPEETVRLSVSFSFCYSNSSVLLFNYGTILFVMSFYKEPFTHNGIPLHYFPIVFLLCKHAIDGCLSTIAASRAWHAVPEVQLLRNIFQSINTFCVNQSHLYFISSTYNVKELSLIGWKWTQEWFGCGQKAIRPSWSMNRAVS